MKMVKSLLLGSAAGLIAVAGAQAADLPVKAAPVEYVKICSLYGAGYYYVPGTDICIKIGGFVRAQYYAGNNNPSDTPLYAGVTDNQNTRLWTSGDDFMLRGRAAITVDTRSPTEWGTVRTYLLFGFTTQTPTNIVNSLGGGTSLYSRRAFIQWAGFTFGRAQSFFDIFPQGSLTYWGVPTHDSGDQGTLLAAYTAQWGNGISTTLSVEEQRKHAVVNVDAISTDDNSIGGVTIENINNDAVQQRFPDVVANFRIDQAWGSFQVAGALHDASAAYYGDDCPAVGNSITGAMDCGHPGDKWGWAASVGATIKLPFIAPGDRFAFQVNFSEGAYRYVANNPGVGDNPVWFDGSRSLGVGWGSDAVLSDRNPATGTGGTLELTEAWGFVAAYEHKWTPFLKTSWYGGAYEVDYNANATNYLCQQFALANTAGGPFDQDSGRCDPNFGVWFVGSRTQWNIRPDFYMGVDVIYQNLKTAHDGAFAEFKPDSGNARPEGVYKFEDQDALAVTFRVQRSFVP